MLNPWVVVDTTVCHPNEFVMPDNAVLGVLVLTKRLGMQVIMPMHQWLDIPDKWNKNQASGSPGRCGAEYQEAMMNMARLNRTVAGLACTFNAHAATNITGF